MSFDFSQHYLFSTDTNNTNKHVFMHAHSCSVKHKLSLQTMFYSPEQSFDSNKRNFDELE